MLQNVVKRSEFVYTRDREYRYTTVTYYYYKKCPQMSKRTEGFDCDLFHAFAARSVLVFDVTDTDSGEREGKGGIVEVKINTIPLPFSFITLDLPH